MEDYCENWDGLPYNVNPMLVEQLVNHFSILCIFYIVFICCHFCHEIFEMDVLWILFLIEKIVMMFSSKKQYDYGKIGPLKVNSDT